MSAQNADTGRRPRWYRRLPESARVVPPSAYDHCSGTIEVMTPDAVLRPITCARQRRRHGRWHENRRGVRWRGRWKRPVYHTEWIDSEADKFAAQFDGTDRDR